jgi:Protein of unknown function (DUF2752)
MHRASRSGIDPRIIFRCLSAISVSILIMLVIVPLEALERYPAFCPFKRFLGIECYGCGMTRALCALLHGHVQLALQYNRGVLFAFPMLVACGACFSLPEFKKAFTISWLIVTMITLATVVAPTILSESQIGRITPQCDRKVKTGQPCFFCGMTTGFIDIAHGRWREAERANLASVPLYAGFVCNGLCLGIFLSSKSRQPS